MTGPSAAVLCGVKRDKDRDCPIEVDPTCKAQVQACGYHCNIYHLQCTPTEGFP